VGFGEESFPEHKVGHLVLIEAELAFLIWSGIFASSDPSKDVTGQGNDIGCLVELAFQRLECLLEAVSV
jgi:hypothetical protein